MKRTVLRVKRRRDEPAPDLFKLEQPSLSAGSESNCRKRGKEDAEQLRNMMDNVHFSAPPSKRPALGTRDFPNDKKKPQSDETSPPPILFRRMSRDRLNRDNHKRKAIFDLEKSQVNLVEARLETDFNRGNDATNEDDTGIYTRDSKRTKISLSLQMVESRIILEKEFWKMHSTNADKHSTPCAKGGFNPDKGLVRSSIQGKKTGKAALRERMKRNATKASGFSTTSHSNSSPKSKSLSRVGNVILDPLSRKVNDSLCAIYQCFSNDNNISNAESKIMEHIEMLQHSIASSASNITKYVNWVCSNGSGSILHHVALMNNTMGARELCRLFGSHLDFSIGDEHGKSAMTVAKEVQAEGVLQVFEGYGGQLANEEQKGTVEDDDDFVYDVYCLDESSLSMLDSDKKITEQSCNNDLGVPKKLASSSSNPISVPHNHLDKKGSEENVEPTVVNVRGGIGYWLDGNLVIDVDNTEDFDDSDFDDDDYDSNREDCDANDYPDEDCFAVYDDDCGGSNDGEYCVPSFRHRSQLTSNLELDDEDFSDSEDDKLSFRNRSVQFNNMKKVTGESGFHQNYFCEDDEMANDGDYRGFMYADSERWSSERLRKNNVAFDPDLDGSD